MTTTLSPESPSSESEPRVADMTPVELWRHPCRVLDQLYVSGDLPIRSAEFDAQLDQWIDEGITHIVDLRGEHSDADRVADRHPHVTYVWLGTHDDGGTQDASWFDAGVDAILDALADPDAKVIVHCHMGVNRAPSLVFAALLALGYGIEEGLAAIREARPIANILYADSAVRWFGRRQGWTGPEIGDAVTRVWAWRSDNPCDVRWVIHRIRQVERTEWGL